MRKLKTILQSKWFFKIICLIVFGYSLFLIITFPFQSKYCGNEEKITGIVSKYEIDDKKVMIYLRGKEMVVVNYYFSDDKKAKFVSKNLKLGQRVEVSGILKEPSSNTIPNLFNYKKYLKYKKIFYVMNASSLKIKKLNISVFYEIKNKMLLRIDEIDSTGYLRTFLLGDKSKLVEDVMLGYQENGISHLFSISGMHVSFLTGFLLFFLNKVSYNNRYKYSVVSCFLLFYLFLTDMSASILRTTVMFLVFSINRCWNLKVKSLDLLLCVLSIVLVINPFLLCDVGFQFSYFISAILILNRKKFQKIKGKFLSNLYLSCFCFLVSIPICLYHFGQLNVLSIFFNLIMIPIVSSVIFPMSFIVFCVPGLFPVYHKMIWALEEMNSIFLMFDFLRFIFIKPSIFIILIYCVVLMFVFYRKGFLILLILLLIIHKFYPYLDGNFLMTALDVGQGDATFVKLPFDQGNVLIDTGGLVNENINSKSNITNNKLIPYFGSLGITRLDYLILTHGDYDHMGEAINLIENFKVEKVIFNCGEFNELEQELIEVLNKKKIPYYSCIKELNIDNNKLYFLNNQDYGNENDNSSVIYTELNNHKFLFMGDAGVEVEEDILDKYNLNDIDVLKVGHHGSKTSSGKNFIYEINPSYSIISVGKNNKYGHPNKEVLNNLEDSTIYRTDKDGSIMFKIKNNKLKIETYSP